MSAKSNKSLAEKEENPRRGSLRKEFKAEGLNMPSNHFKDDTIVDKPVRVANLGKKKRMRSFAKMTHKQNIRRPVINMTITKSSQTKVSGKNPSGEISSGACQRNLIVGQHSLVTKRSAKPISNHRPSPQAHAGTQAQTSHEQRQEPGEASYEPSPTFRKGRNEFPGPGSYKI